MCNNFSCIVLKDGEVLWKQGESSHEAIIDIYKGKYLLRDNAEDFARVEIVPQNSNYRLPIRRWHFRVDQTVVPSWFTEWHKAEAQKAASKWRRNWVRSDDRRKAKELEIVRKAGSVRKWFPVGCLVKVVSPPDGNSFYVGKKGRVAENDGEGKLDIFVEFEDVRNWWCEHSTLRRVKR